MTIKKDAEKVFDFGEKKKEKVKDRDTQKWVELEVWQSPKYLQSKKKAIELIEKGNYGLDEADFWILMNKGGEKMVYSGLIISHDGCLKINDQLDEKLKFEPESAVIYKDEAGGKSVVMSYINSAQKIYEFGEISPNNCKNEYPYAMVLKRLFDRVVLRTSKIGFFGIYSVSESDSFTKKEEGEEKQKDELKSDRKRLGDAIGDDMQQMQRAENERQFKKIKEDVEACGSLSELQALWEKSKKAINALLKYCNKDDTDLYLTLFRAKEAMKESLNPSEEQNP